ncbi:unnamed protein product [Pseudo-nitzschia multistriata]|uniref:Uncharacterized protein n=1 Tax=Pseudo-nitzschia multistriata TaxID=183589 RepID=A0A448ZMF3_9STRA|nr:unnamed protein product [Pseudo-nitzschia multistriata]
MKNGRSYLLSQIRHHSVNCIPHEDDVTIGPTSEEFRCSVVKVTLLHRIRWRCVENSHNFVRPPFVQRFDVLNQIFLGIRLIFSLCTTPSGRRFFGARW